MNNSLTQNNAPTNLSFVNYITSEKVKSRIYKSLDGESGKRFISSITSAVSTNPALQGCTPASVVNAALLGESLKLSPSPQLGHFYIVPYNKKEKDGNYTKVGQFQIGYKGYLQLAYRSGGYKKITVMEVKQGELIKYDPFNEIFEARYIEDFNRDGIETAGYYAAFELKSGLRKVIYWSKEKMLRHADTYSQAFKASEYERLVNTGKIVNGKLNEKDQWKYSSNWYKNFDEMGNKTLLRQLISKWGIISIENDMIATAIEKDMGVIDDDGNADHIDSPEPAVSDNIIDTEAPPIDVPANIPPEEPQEIPFELT